MFHVDAPEQALADLYGQASIFWHATGLGEDAEADPNRMEHFGISIVEAMSAGAVPVVLGVAGPAEEVVEPGVSGRHFTDLTDLVAQTVELIGDPDELLRLSATARSSRPSTSDWRPSPIAWMPSWGEWRQTGSFR